MFRFYETLPSKDVLEPIQHVNNLTTSQYETILSSSFSFIENIDVSMDVNGFVEHYSKNENVELSCVKNMFKTLLLIATESAKNKLTPGQVYTDLQMLKMHDERASTFCEMWKRIYADDDRTDVIKVSENKLVDVKWNFGVTASSSEINRVGNCFLQMNLTVAKGGKLENILMELTLTQFYEFMHEMEKAKLSLTETVE